jgi:flagellar P-ring protein FlgI
MGTAIKRKLLWFIAACLPLVLMVNQGHASTRLKDLARIEGARSNDLVGYGLVVGLAGTGDSPRSKATMQSVTNALLQFGVNVPSEDVNTRNVAAVVLTATLPPFSQPGDGIDVNVSSMGDARSLVGGTLLMAPMRAVNNVIYALAQGQISVGGFQFDYNGNVVQKNHPTVGMIPSGGSVERSTIDNLVSEQGTVNVLLSDPDFTTASRIKSAVNERLGTNQATALNAGKVVISLPEYGVDLVDFITMIENIELVPDRVARVVINERTGTVVSGGDVRISDVTISHGDIRLTISTSFQASQPRGVNVAIGGIVSGGRTLLVPNTEIEVQETVATAIELPVGTSISELVGSLRQVKTSTRDVITILQGIKRAGALHAQLIIQ